MRTLITTVATLALTAAAQAQEESQMSMDDVPAAVMEAAQAESEAMNVTLEGVQMDDDQGTDTFELSGTMENGMMFEVDVLEDGTVEEIEEEIEMAAVPEAVAAALDENLPGFEPSFVERSTRPMEDGRVVFEFEGQHEGGEVDVEIDEDGSNYMVNEDAAG
jgi:hypothetical protein